MLRLWIPRLRVSSGHQALTILTTLQTLETSQNTERRLPIAQGEYTTHERVTHTHEPTNPNAKLATRWPTATMTRILLFRVVLFVRLCWPRMCCRLAPSSARCPRTPSSRSFGAFIARQQNASQEPFHLLLETHWIASAAGALALQLSVLHPLLEKVSAFLLLRIGRSPPPFAVVKPVVPVSPAALSKSSLNFLVLPRRLGVPVAPPVFRAFVPRFSAFAIPEVLIRPNPRLGSSSPSALLAGPG